MLDKGDTVGLIACSDAISAQRKEQIDEIENYLYDMGYKAIVGEHIYNPEKGPAFDREVRAQDFIDMINNPDIKAIFDVSGGEVANEVLSHLDYDAIEAGNKMIFGYSDVTTVLNAIYQKSGVCTYLYQIRNIISEHGERQKADLLMALHEESDDLFDFDYYFARGNRMKGVVIGGNARCFLKLAGTPYMPSFRHKILLLESYAGKEAKIRAYFTQLQQMGAFDEVNGVILGTFTELEASGEIKAVNIFTDVCENKDLPIVVTSEIGHGADSKAIVIGKEIELEE